MQTISLSAARRRDKVVILTGPAIGVKYSTPIGVRLSRALSALWKWAKCRCTARNIFRAIFCEKVSMAVAVVVVAAMWWHNISIDNVIEAQEAVGTDCLFGMPWAIVWAIRATFADIKSAKKGGSHVRV